MFSQRQCDLNELHFLFVSAVVVHFRSVMFSVSLLLYNSVIFRVRISKVEENELFIIYLNSKNLF